MLKRLYGFCLCLGLGIGLTCGAPAFAGNTPTAELNDAVLFFVNDPRELTYTDLNKLVERNKEYHQERGTLTTDQVSSFFEHMQQFGVKNAGDGTNQIRVGYVVQSQGFEPIGVIVVKGDFDRPKLLDLLKKHYSEHSDEHSAAVMKANTFSAVQKEKAVNPYIEEETTLFGHSAHIFPMPLRGRELIAVSTKDAVLISSAPRGNRNLLQQTVDVVDGKVAMQQPSPNSHVVFTFAASAAEKQEIDKRIWTRYNDEKKDSITQKKHMKKLGERIRQKVIKNKVEFMVESLDDMDQATLTIDRGNAGEMTKTASLVAKFENASRASEIKKNIMKHLIKEIKRNDNVQDKFALGNVSITTQGNQLFIRCQFRDSKEQLHGFNLISSYIAKGLLERL
ncbi:MAG: hypothetical protein HQM09_12900 [Candidatus Riflebacteria bacterium]|nr:hypothetical protein [Candidatus Riflebacteria bacterium]